MEKTFQKTAAGVIIVMMAFVVFAFSRTYFGLLPNVGHLDLIIHVHVVSVCLWMIMLVVQPILIYKKQWDIHRAIGYFSYAFVPFLMFTCILTIRHMQLNHKDLFVFTINIFMLILFNVYYLLAIYYRKRNTHWHGRFMILTIIPFIGPAAARVQYDVHAIELAIITTLLTVEFFRNRVFKPYLIGIACYIVLFVPLMLVLIFGMAFIERLWVFCFA